MGMVRGKLMKLIEVAGLMLFAAIVAGCSQIDRFHGFIPPADELDTLAVGATTKDEVISLFGPPISERALDNNTIYYASSHFRHFGPFVPQEVDRQVLAIDFDVNDRISNIARYTLEDEQIVVLDRRVTEDGISDVTILGQLLGSFGRVDAGALLGEEPAQP